MTYNVFGGTLNFAQSITSQFTQPYASVNSRCHKKWEQLGFCFQVRDGRCYHTAGAPMPDKEP